MINDMFETIFVTIGMWLRESWWSVERGDEFFCDFKSTKEYFYR
jgi:hypothetical protein